MGGPPKGLQGAIPPEQLVQIARGSRSRLAVLSHPTRGFWCAGAPNGPAAVWPSTRITTMQRCAACGPPGNRPCLPRICWLRVLGCGQLGGLSAQQDPITRRTSTAAAAQLLPARRPAAAAAGGRWEAKPAAWGGLLLSCAFLRTHPRRSPLPSPCRTTRSSRWWTTAACWAAC